MIKPLGHQNYKWWPIFKSYLAWFAGKTSEWSKGCLFKPAQKRLIDCTFCSTSKFLLSSPRLTRINKADDLMCVGFFNVGLLLMDQYIIYELICRREFSLGMD